ncbi:MAG: AMP-binding protein, partial [Acidimicrobiales bacterium]
MSVTPTEVALGTGRALSPMQRSLWVSQLHHPEAPVQNMPLLSHLDGPVDAERLATAFGAVVAGSDALRTRLSAPASQPGGHWQVELVALGELPETEIVEVARTDVERWARDRGRRPIDLTVAGYDSAIAVHEDGTASWYLNLHHVITDATSSALVFEATARAYHDPAGHDPAAAEGAGDGASYYRWARALAANLDRPVDSVTERAIAHWRSRPPAPRTGRLYRPADRPTPPAERLPLPLGPELLGRAQERLAGEYRMLTDDLAWSTLLVTATAVYWHRITGATGFAIGLPVHNRSDPATRTLIGPTMEVFPVDISIEADDSFRTVHKRIGRAILSTLRYAAPGTSPAADYEAVVNVIPRARQQRFGAIPANTRWLHSGAIDSSHLLRVQMTAYAPDDGSAEDSEPDTGRPGAEFAIDVNHGGADGSHRGRAAGHFTTVLSALVSDPDSPIGGSTLCGPDELDALRRWESEPDFPTEIGGTETGLTIDRLRSVLAGNGATVIEQPLPGGADRVITGDELWRWVARLSGELRRLDVAGSRRVGIELPRSVEAVVAILATMASGGSFVPLDPSQPPARRRRLAARAGCAVVLSSKEDIAAFGPDGDRDPGGNHPAVDFDPAKRRPSDEAYLLFTSGSTGEPKGVPITELGLARYLRFAEESYTEAGSAPIAPLFSPLTFDLTITSLFVPILAGGKLIVIEPDGPSGLSSIAERTDINWCKATPSHLEILVRLLPPDHRLRTLVVGGEAFGTRLAIDLLAARPELEIYNEYGPTEAVVGCMLYELEGDLLSRQPEVPIGRPAPGVKLLVLDEHLQRVPIGSPGELCIAHEGLTTGYLASDAEPVDEETSFVQIEGVRFYRSGDLVRLLDERRLVYLGRKDEQVKVGGIRLEPIEVEDRLNAHPAIERSAVRLWSPNATGPADHCVRCGLPDNVPGVEFDEAGVCQTCHDYQRVAPVAESWFRTPADLSTKLERARAAATGDHDCVHLLSGGKDSTYALYRLVDLGFRPYALTLDNGFISEEAKANVRRSVADLGIDHEFATTDSMNAIFRDSLDRYSNVCHGCYKTIYTVATNRAVELGAPLIVTGLSRGQLFETRLIPQQFSADRFDPEAIDRAVIEARKIYHRVDDGPNRLLDTEVFADDELFDRIEYLDIYRYLDIELSEMFRFLDQRAPWVRPSDTGRSTNCLINAAGIHTHQTEQGYHNYAVPYAWDVRLGRKTRSEAIEELDDRLDLDEVDAMLHTVGYRPRRREVLTAWIEPTAEAGPIPDPAELRSFLARSLPSHAIPAAFVVVDELPLSTNGKLDRDALPGPKRVHRPGPTIQLGADQAGEGPRAAVGPLTDLERSIIEVWERVLQIEPIAADDDFFALGGDSLAALEMIVALGEAEDRHLAEDLGFTNPTPAELARAIELLDPAAANGSTAGRSDPRAFATDRGTPPSRSAGELAVLFEQAGRPDEIMYNVGRLYRVDGSPDPDRFEAALRTVAERHQPLSWSHGTTRKPLPSRRAVSFVAEEVPIAAAGLDERCLDVHRTPFDLENGPVLRCLFQPIDDGTTAVVLAIHHASGDAVSFGALWDQIGHELSAGADSKVGRAGSPDSDSVSLEPEPDSDSVSRYDYAGFCRWQESQIDDADRDHWRESSGLAEPASLAIHPPSLPEPDGFISRRASVSAAELRTATATSAAGVALAAVAATVRSFSDGPEVEIGLITSTRNHPVAEDLFGYLLNTVPIRLRCDGNDSLDQLSERAASAIGGALAHRSYPLARIVADRSESERPRPNLDVLMAFDELNPIELDGMATEQRVLSNGTAVAPLTFFFELRGDDVELSLEHRGSAVGATMASRMLDALDQTLSEAVAGVRSAPPAGSVIVGEPLTDDTLIP